MMKNAPAPVPVPAKEWPTDVYTDVYELPEWADTYGM